MNPPQPLAALPPASPAPETPSVPVVKKTRRKRSTVREIDAALVLFRGHRAKTAEHLGMTVHALSMRIQHHEFLRSKWSRSMVKMKLQMEAQAPPQDPIGKLDLMIENHQVALDANAQRILAQIRRLEKRIELGEGAILEPDNPKYNNFRFRLSEKGEPSEEKMLREQYAILMEEYRKTMESSANQAYTKAKILRELRGGKPDKPNQNRPGFSPKGTTQIVAQPGSNVNINPPAAPKT